MARYKVTDTKEAREVFAEKEEVFSKIKLGMYGAAVATTLIAYPITVKIAMWAAAIGYNAVVNNRENNSFCKIVADRIYSVFKKCQNISKNVKNYYNENNDQKIEEKYFQGTEKERKAATAEAEEKKWRDYAETRKILEEAKKKQKEKEAAAMKEANENGLVSREFQRRVNAIQNEGYYATKNNGGRHLK